MPDNVSRFGAVTLTDSGYSIKDVRTHVEYGIGDQNRLNPLVNEFYFGYYTNILTPRDVVVTPDLSAGDGDDTVTDGEISEIIIGDSITANFNNSTKWLKELSKGEFKPSVDITTVGNGNDILDGNDSQGFDVSTKGVDIIFGGEGNDTITGAGFLVGSGFKITTDIELKLKEIFSKPKSGDSQVSNDDAKKAAKKSKLLSFKGWEYVSNDTEIDTVTGVGPLDIIAGSKGNDILTAKSYYAWIDGKDGNDFIDAKQAVGAWIEGGKGDDTIFGPNIHPQFGGLGSVIFGDEFSATNPSNKTVNVELGIEFEWGKSLKVNGLVSVLRMTGSGKDVIHTGTGVMNLVFGGSGEDTIYGKGYINLIVGDEFNLAAGIKIDLNLVTLKYDWKFDAPGFNGVFNDTIYGTKNSIDIVFGGGGDGDDTLTGGDFANFIFGDGLDFGIGNPFLQIEQLKELKFTTAVGLLPLGTGVDKIVGGSGLDFIIGGDKNDLISAGDGFNVVFGDEITLASGLTADLSQVFTTPQSATSFITPGLTGTGDDTILGGDSTDVIFGGKGNDHILTFDGIDLLYGNDGNDYLCAGAGNDILFGGDGSDWLDGGPNNDIHQGGAGPDNFVFDNPSSEKDSFFNIGGWITDFDLTQGDQDRSGDPTNPCLTPPQTV